MLHYLENLWKGISKETIKYSLYTTKIYYDAIIFISNTDKKALFFIFMMQNECFSFDMQSYEWMERNANNLSKE